MERLLGVDVREQLKGMFSEMGDKVNVLFFETNGETCVYCEAIKQLLNELKEISDKINFEFYHFEDNKELASKYHLDKAPAIVVVGKNKGLIRFFGIPGGHEFGAFVSAIIDASKGDSDELPKELKDMVLSIKNKVHIQVFVTPSCPYCPAMAHLVYIMALYNPNIIADVVEAEEFIQLSRKYNVSGVPKTIVNEELTFLGAQPPDVFINKIKKEIG